MILNTVVCCYNLSDGVVAEELPQSVHLFDSPVVGEESVVTDAVEAGGQYVNEKAPNKLVGGQGHDLVTITLPGTIVLPLER